MKHPHIEHKDRFGEIIEPGDTIMRARHSEFDELVVERCTHKTIITDQLRLQTDRYDDTSWQYSNGKWTRIPGTGILKNIINITKLNQKLEKHD